MKFKTLALLAALPLLASATSPAAMTAQGPVKGVEENNISVFKGIPYAQPPVGELRWRLPQEPKQHADTLDCTRFGAASLQADRTPGSFYWKEFYQEGDPVRSEDCLYLNIWTPAADNGKRPVILWIHGGAYTGGYGHETEFDGRAFAGQGVILVTINYRLGMLGFLSHPILSADDPDGTSGNYGLYDQLAAVRWVKDNIASFGGDPDNITIMGQSAGAGSVQALVSSPLAEGLVSKAIIMSGGGLGGIIAPRTQADALKAGEAMWASAGIRSAEDMRAYPVEKFNELTANYMMSNPGVGLPFSPCVDGRLLTGTFDDVARAGNQLDIPYMIGYTSEDLAPQVMEKAAADWSLLLEGQGLRPAFVYRFCHDLPGEDLPAEQGGMKGAFHSSELWYVFDTLGRCWRPMTAADTRLSDQMVRYWTNFARTGNPNGAALAPWMPYTAANPAVMEFDIDTAVEFSNPEVTVTRKDGFHMFETFDHTTMYLVEGSDRALLIDTGTRCKDLDSIVAKITPLPVDVVITHLHPDHAGCIGYFPEVWMHAADTVMLDEYSYPGTLRFCEDGHKFDLGGRTIEVMLCPGHTPGSIVLFDRESGDCFTGDAFGSGGVWMQLEPHVSMTDYLLTCARFEKAMADGACSRLWVGHFPYVKRTFDKDYITRMKNLAGRLAIGDTFGAIPYQMPKSIHSLGNPHVLMDPAGVSIVYNADKIN